MRVVVAPGSFGALTPLETAQIIGDQWTLAAPHVEVIQLPQADGGAGTAAVLAGVAEAAPTVIDVDGLPVAAYLKDSTAWLDSSAAPDRVALGSAVRMLLDDGVRDLRIGLGSGAGTASDLDGGRSFVEGLIAGPADAAVVRNAAARLSSISITALVDIDRQLLGFQGACYSAVEAWGISKADAQRAEGEMGAWVDVTRAAVSLRRDLLQGTTIRPERLAGAGAAGGLGFGLAVLGAQLVSAPAYSARATDLAQHLAGANLAVTAARVFDWRMLEHSVPAEVTAACTTLATPVILLADEVHVGRREQMSLGLQGVYSISRSGWVRPAAPEATELSAELPLLVDRVAATWTPPARHDVP